MNTIGGYLDLEMRRKMEYHADSIRLNTGRNALEYILLAKKYRKIYLPFYFCDVLLQPLKKLEIDYCFYSINEKLEAVFDFDKIKNDEAFLCINYFGLKEDYTNAITPLCKNLIIDNAQAFFAMPVRGVDTFYSPRKFFGLPDGSYLYTDKMLETELEQDISYNRFEHLLRRIDETAETAYPFFKANEESLNNKPLLRMSKLTQTMLQNIEYSEVASIRRANYIYIHKELKKINNIQIELSENAVPLVYPFYTNNPDLRKKMLDNSIYCAQYWPNVLQAAGKESIEYKLTSNLLQLPIDQRYGFKDMEYIIETVING